jgi:prepilin-type N-terminal cleavage/methylation domain-containing protein
MNLQRGQSLIELLIAIAIASIILPAILTGLVLSREGRGQQNQRLDAINLAKETEVALINIRDRGWSYISTNGTFYPTLSGSQWVLTSGTTTANGFTKSVVIDDVYRNSSGTIVTSGGSLDPSTKMATITVSWTKPYPSQTSSILYLSRYRDNLLYSQTTAAQFNTATLNNTQVTNTSGGEVTLANNNKAKWCSPSFSSSTIDLPDGPPVAVAARANSTVAKPNDVLVATAPQSSNSIKLTYVSVTADTDPPVSSIRGKFTLDSAQYSNSGLVPSGIGIDNSFKTNDVKYYTSSSRKLYALIATTKPDKEVVAVLVNDNDDNSNSEYQDSTNKIYKYWTYFNTRIYNSTSGDTGFLDPTANVADTGGDNDGFGSNPTRAYTNDSSFAVDSNSGSGTGTNCTGSDKDKHKYYNYNFSLPSGTTINGIEVRLDAKVDNTTGAPKMCVQLSWDGGSTWTTAKSSNNLTTSEATYTLGGSSDTWGRTWNDSNFSNSNFRVRVINVASNTSRDFSLDWASVKVYYNGGISPLNDQAPFDYGATTLTVMGDRGYVASGGYLYVFDLSNIDSRSPSSELNQIGCRIQLDGYDCQPGSPASDKKYNAGQTGTSWGDVGSPAHNDCSDGGNVELYGTNDLDGVQVGGNSYIYAAVGAGTNPELNIINVTNVPDGSSSPSITNSSCGRSSGGNAGWKLVGSYDFNSNSGTEEAANSVYAKSDGTRAYISSNGTSDSKQFYIINTTNKSSPSFLSGSPSSGPSSGYYQSTGANGELYPRRSLTVLNGQRAVLVGKDGVSNTNNAQEYQVLSMENEGVPAYCGGIDFDEGFNDLTSVIEADSDTFVYMVANNTVNELKIIQGGPDGTYYGSGTIESATFDSNYSTAFNRIFSTVTLPPLTSLQFQLGIADAINGSCNSVSFNFVGPDGTANTYYSANSNGETIFSDDDNTSYENPARCFRYKAYLSTTNYNATPVLQDISVNYSP